MHLDAKTILERIEMRDLSVKVSNNSGLSLIIVALTISVMFVGEVGAATILSSSVSDWNVNSNVIVRDNQILPISAPSLSSGGYDYIEDVGQDGTMSHSGLLSNSGGIYQRVYSYTGVGASSSYSASNVAGETVSMLMNQVGSAGRIFTQHDVSIPDGTILLRKADGGGDLRGLSAIFNLEVTRDYEIGSRTVSRRVLRGSVSLIGMRNGSVRVLTRGALKRTHIASISNENTTIAKGNRRMITNRDIRDIMNGGDIFLVELEGMDLPVRLCAASDVPVTFTSRLSSSVTNIGDNSGSEISFIPGGGTSGQVIDPNPVVPEPTTIMFLGTGMLAFLRRRKRSQQAWIC